MTCNLPSGGNFKITFGIENKFKMTLGHMQLVGNSNKFLIDKSVTETYCNRLVNHGTSKIFQISKLSPVSLMTTGLKDEG